MKQSSVYDILAQELDPAFARRARIILENLEIKVGDKILEIGCGRGFYGRAVADLFPSAFYTGIEKNGAYVAKANQLINKSSIRFQKGDATKLPFPDNVFSKIICSEVLEHIEDDGKALSEMYRVLAPGGTVIITVPNSNYPFFWDPLNWILERMLNRHIPSNIWWLAGIWADHARLYNEDDLTEKVKRAGFTVQKRSRATHYCLPFSHFLLYGIGKNIVEAGFLRSFDRFSTEKKSSILLTLVLSLVKWMDMKNDSISLSSRDSFVNILVKATK